MDWFDGMKNLSTTNKQTNKQNPKPKKTYLSKLGASSKFSSCLMSHMGPAVSMTTLRVR